MEHLAVKQSGILIQFKPPKPTESCTAATTTTTTASYFCKELKEREKKKKSAKQNWIHSNFAVHLGVKVSVQ